MISLFDLWEEFIGTANTHQGGHVKPNRNFVKWCNTISKDIFNDEYKDFEESQVISDKLTPFLRTANIIIKSVSSQMWDEIKFPDDYNYFASARILTKNKQACGCSAYPTIDGATGKEGQCQMLDPDEMLLAQAESDDNLCELNISKVDNSRWSAVCSHKTLRPTFTSPKCTQFERGMKVAPKRLGVIILDYFRKPKEASFDYTIINPGEENEYIQFNADGSQSLEWDDKMIPEFINRLLVKYGIFNREATVYQAGKAEI